MDRQHKNSSSPLRHAFTLTLKHSHRHSHAGGKNFMGVMGVVLCLVALEASSARAAPVSSDTVLRQFDPYLRMDLGDTEEALALLRILGALWAAKNDVGKQQRPLSPPGSSSSISDWESGTFGDLNQVKRGFGIAGLDNVDMITSTLDKSRALARARHGRFMNSGLNFKQLRALMERAG